MKNLLLILIILLTGCVHVRPWTAAEKTLLITSWVAAGADYSTTKNALSNPNNYEMNPIMGEHPDDTKLITYMLSSQIIATGLAHFFPKYRKMLLGGKTVVNTGCAINNSQLD
jgi:hypothetical protein